MKQFLLILSFCLITNIVYSQNQAQDETETEVPVKLLPYTNPLTDSRDEAEVETDTLQVTKVDKEVLRRISNAYKMHVLAIDAQVQGDLVQAEDYINKAFAAIQSMMDDFPEVQNNRRFTELYRSVMAEHSEFYGIKEVKNGAEGEIFAIREELFSEEDDWIAEGYTMPDNLTFNKTEVPLVENQHVNRHLIYYTQKRPDVMERWLERSEYYFPMMIEIFEEEGVPTELVHLSMIESGLVPTARSWASAVGMWQFIRATGSVYGLEANWWVDERQDPIKATRAAARHLRDLYEVWGDWHLAMANYNISPRGLRRAINAAGGEEDYWVAYPYLPRETRGYVPGFIAATMIAMNPEEFGFQRDYGQEAYSYEVAEVDGLMPLEKLAEAAGITVKELKDLNPELLRWATPPGGKYPLKIPTGIKDDFLAAYQEIPQEERSTDVAMHTVSSGETLGYIAQRYGTSVRSLFATNEGLSSTIYPGQTIVVPVASGPEEEISSNRPSNQGTSSSSSRRRASASSNTTGVTYTVKSGDTIGHVAEWYDVRAWQIRSWNGIGNTIRVGQRLTIYVSDNRVNYYNNIDGLAFAQKQEIERRQRSGENIFDLQVGGSSGSGDTVTYTVRRNDTLTGIANRYGVTVNDIKNQNNLSSSRIYAGQTLKITKR
ncbi:MAG: LysM peptidoglycan-binding domain-containing protein [Balneolaceae bacterium]|nr:LysM peptidoglycan-binding domain-containing protein [Balneolaceae bacterium]